MPIASAASAGIRPSPACAAASPASTSSIAASHPESDASAAAPPRENVPENSPSDCDEVMVTSGAMRVVVVA
ncbi:hypothetical protein Pta02_27480 [Planobispora takensis]|uniref:Uncharacterized protein n=1 Tax=Planobispora takensis TaxID=1367882 RepID=A0A8J3SWR6_9ACTN|nr:hypothetical protein Pta02_27480 [Planobispora takensis]